MLYESLFIMSFDKIQILKEEITEQQVRDIIRSEIARVFFDLYRKRQSWKKA